MDDFDFMDALCEGKHPNNPLTSISEIVEFLKTDYENPMVYCLYKSVNKDKLTIEQIRKVDMSIQALKSHNAINIKRNLEYMDRHLIEDNINDDIH